MQTSRKANFFREVLNFISSTADLGEKLQKMLPSKYAIQKDAKFNVVITGPFEITKNIEIVDVCDS